MQTYLALSLVLASACTFSRAAVITGAASATVGTGLIVAGRTGSHCTSGAGCDVFNGTVESITTTAGASLIVGGLVLALVGLAAAQDDKPSRDKPTTASVAAPFGHQHVGLTAIDGPAR